MSVDIVSRVQAWTKPPVYGSIQIAFVAFKDKLCGPNEGQAVEFEVKKGPKGLQAENVTGL